MANTFGYKVGDVLEYQHENKQLWIIEEKCIDFWGDETGDFRCRPLHPLLYEDIKTCYWHENQIYMWMKIIQETEKFEEDE
jgi:hypothetical protein